MSTQTEAVLDFKELRFVSIKCNGCGTKVILDAGSQANVPRHCCSCEQPFPVCFIGSIEQYCAVFKQLQDSKNSVQIHVSLSHDPKSSANSQM